MRQKVTITMPPELHAELHNAVEQGRLRSAGVKNVSQAYELAVRLLLAVLENE